MSVANGLACTALSACWCWASSVHRRTPAEPKGQLQLQCRLQYSCRAWPASADAAHACLLKSDCCCCCCCAEYRPVGCYVDSGTARRLWSNQGLVASTAECYEKIRANNFILFGLQNGNECWASDDFDYATSLGTSTACNKPCSTGEFCGGSYVNSIYSIGKGFACGLVAEACGRHEVFTV